VSASVIGLCYYLRIIFALYGAPSSDTGMAPACRPPTLARGTALAALTLALLVLGTWPEPAIEIVRAAIARSTPL
jgi:NADH:ubiquinone oxidoreductase subunit 2 (subunit N)